MSKITRFHCAYLEVAFDRPVVLDPDNGIAYDAWEIEDMAEAEGVDPNTMAMRLRDACNRAEQKGWDS